MNYTTQYDEQLINQFEHLKRHPQLLPFIGSEWNESPHKLLIVAESHYLHEKYNNMIGHNEWNDLSFLKSFNDKKIFDWTNTRANVDGFIEGWEHPIHQRLAKSINNVYHHGSALGAYRKVAFYNYFQRPAEEKGESIIKGTMFNEDYDLAFDLYQSLINVIKPKWIMFLSKPAFDAYKKKKGGKKELNVSRVSHPTTSYWNRKTKQHDDRTSKEKFEEIIGKVF